MPIKKAWFGILIFILFVSCTGGTGSQTEFVESTGELDTEFMDNLDAGFMAGSVGSVDALALSDDENTLYIGGRLQKSGTDYSWAKISKLGVFDTEFPYSSVNDSVYGLHVDGDNVWAVGAFNLFSSTTAKGILKWNSLFVSLDSTFVASLGTGFSNSGSNPTITEILKDSQGNYLVAGQFTTLGASPVVGLARLSSDGLAQSSFNSYFVSGIGGGSVDSMIELQDGRYVLGGSFTSYAGNSVGRIMAMSQAGVWDTQMRTAFGSGFNSNVLAIAQDDSQKIWTGGSFDRWNSNLYGPLVVFDVEGNKVADFPVGVDTALAWSGQVRSMALQPNSKMLVGGMLTRVNSVAVTGGGLIRVDTETGAIDEALSVALGSGFSGGSVRAVLLDSSGKIYVAGDFTSFNGRTVPGLVKFK